MQRIRNHQVAFALGWFASIVFAESATAAEAGLSNEQLAEKAGRLQALVEDKLLQHHGMVPMLVRATDYQFPTAEDYRGAYRHRHLRGKTEEEVGIAPMHVWRAWENTTSNTGYYLRTAAYQYRVTGDPEALAICRRSLAALKYIYTLAVEKGEKGFLCKPYGGVYSNQGGADQLQCATWGLAAYREIAPPEDVADIDMMTKDFAEHQLKTDYIDIHGYFGRTNEDRRKEEIERPTEREKAFETLPLLYLAWYGSGDNKFVREIERLHKTSESEAAVSDSSPSYKGNGYGSRKNLYLPSLLMEMEPSRHEWWRDVMLSYYQRNKTGTLPDGTMPTTWSFDPKKGKMIPKAYPGVGGGLAKTGRSALFAMGCVAAQRWFPDEDMKGAAREILERLDEPTFRFVMPYDDENPLSPEWQVESKMLDIDCLSAWLCAYWEGRYRGYW
ncbi:MAG: hypothetical protein WD468_08900 [Pirellulales bacterium]